MFRRSRRLQPGINDSKRGPTTVGPLPESESANHSASGASYPPDAPTVALCQSQDHPALDLPIPKLFGLRG